MATIVVHVSEKEVPAALDALVLECLAKVPDDRPASAAELAQRLRFAVVTDGWTQEQAARWWDLYRPTRNATAGDERETPAKVTKLWM